MLAKIKHKNERYYKQVVINRQNNQLRVTWATANITSRIKCKYYQLTLQLQYLRGMIGTNYATHYNQQLELTFTKLKYNLNQILQNKTSISTCCNAQNCSHYSYITIILSCFPFMPRHAVCTVDFNRFKLARDNE